MEAPLQRCVTLCLLPQEINHRIIASAMDELDYVHKLRKVPLVNRLMLLISGSVMCSHGRRITF